MDDNSINDWKVNDIGKHSNQGRTKLEILCTLVGVVWSKSQIFMIIFFLVTR